jgi:hypothetical protein
MQHCITFFSFYGLFSFTSDMFTSLQVILKKCNDYFFTQTDPRTGPIPMHFTFNPETDSEYESESESERESESESDPSYIPPPAKKWNLRKRRRINSI